MDKIKVWIGYEYEPGHVLIDIKVFDSEQKAEYWTTRELDNMYLWREYEMVEVE